MAGHKALGRGLDALFNAATNKPRAENAGAAATATAPAPESEIRFIPVEAITPNRHQPRTHFDAAALEELSQSIKLHGLAQPLLVTESAPGKYELVVGERRLRASKMAGLATVPCTVKKLSNRERFEVALIENIQRQDLNALEEAVALDGLMREYDLTQDQVASAIGKSRSAVANVLRLLRLHEDVQAALRSSQISEGHAKVLAGVSEHAEQLRLLRIIIDQQMSVRDLEAALVETKPKRKASSASAVQPEVKKMEEDFQRALGRRVEIQTNGKKGWVRFAFYSPMDLELLVRRLGLSDGKDEPAPDQ